MTAHDIAAGLPCIDVLRERCQALALLERIIDGGQPYHGYTTNWGTDEAALMSNGSGDEWTIVFTADGAFIERSVAADREEGQRRSAVDALHVRDPR
jgi:hypothetical protein